MSTELGKIAAKAKAEPTLRLTSLAHVLTPGFLKETWALMNRRGASGVDGVTTEEFEKDLVARLEGAHERLKAGRYQAPPIRRVEIPKGNGKMRPLGIPTVEDHGFRPGRGPHQALRELGQCVVTKKVRHVFEADIQGYFDHINHEWLMRMLEQRIADPVILRLVGKWLRAGVMKDGVVVVTGEGTPRTAGRAYLPDTANIYLHYVLDLWFERRFKKGCQGEAYLVRFADDYVVASSTSATRSGSPGADTQTGRVRVEARGGKDPDDSLRVFREGP